MSISKKCKNPFCGSYFTPSKFKPDQEYCGKDECKRYRDNLRQKKHYRRNIRDPDWRKDHMGRKKQERFERLNRPPPEPDKESPPVSDLNLVLPGMIALFSGAGSREEVMDITAKCRRFGHDLNNGDLCGSEVFQTFPHASFEAKKECSSRQLRG